jgi:hypothetical protein
MALEIADDVAEIEDDRVHGPFMRWKIRKATPRIAFPAGSLRSPAGLALHNHFFGVILRLRKATGPWSP